MPGSTATRASTRGRNDESSSRLVRDRDIFLTIGEMPCQRPSFELLGARLVIEPEIAATAAIHGTDANLDRISAALAALRHTMNDKRANEAADRKFHVSIAEATGNSVLVQLMTSVWEKEFAKNWS